MAEASNGRLRPTFFPGSGREVVGFVVGDGNRSPEQPCWVKRLREGWGRIGGRGRGILGL